MNEPRTVVRDGVRWESVLAPDPSAFWDEWESGWEPDTLALIDSHIGQGDIFLDIGAYVGALSMWALHRGGYPIAVEPDPLAAKCLVINLRSMPEDRYEVFQGAMALQDGTAELIANSVGWGSSMTHLAAVAGNPLGDLPEALEVPATSLQALLRGRTPALVKMDVEGGECLLGEHVGPFCAANGIPLLVAMHEYAWSRPLEPQWFDGFKRREGELGGLGHTVFLP